MGNPETLVVDSTLLAVLHPGQVGQSAGWGNRLSGTAWVRWGSFSVYGVKLHLLFSYPPSARFLRADPGERRAGEADGELLEGANLGGGVAHELFGGLAYRGGSLEAALASAASGW